MCILMRPPLSSRSSTKPRDSKIRACSHSDLGEFLFWWRSCHWGKKIENSLSDFSNFLWWNSLRFGIEVSFLCFQFIREICRTWFSLGQKNTKMPKTKKLPWQPLLFSFLKVSSCQTLPGLRISENFTEGNWRKWKSKPNRRQNWRCLSSFNLRLKALISEVTVEQQILALVCYVLVALIRKIAKRKRIWTFDLGHWRALRDLA